MEEKTPSYEELKQDYQFVVAQLNALIAHYNETADTMNTTLAYMENLCGIMRASIVGVVDPKNPMEPIPSLYQMDANDLKLNYIRNSLLAYVQLLKSTGSGKKALEAYVNFVNKEVEKDGIIRS